MNAEPVEVYINAKGDHICLKQDDYGQETVLTITPKQVDELIACLKEARDELARGDTRHQHPDFSRV